MSSILHAAKRAAAAASCDVVSMNSLLDTASIVAGRCAYNKAVFIVRMRETKFVIVYDCGVKSPHRSANPILVHPKYHQDTTIARSRAVQLRAAKSLDVQFQSFANVLNPLDSSETDIILSGLSNSQLV